MVLQRFLVAFLPWDIPLKVNIVCILQRREADIQGDLVDTINVQGAVDIYPRFWFPRYSEVSRMVENREVHPKSIVLETVHYVCCVWEI